MHFLCESCIFFELRFFAVLPTLMFPAENVEAEGVGRGAEMGLCPLLAALRDAVSGEGSNISQSYFMICLALAWGSSGVFSILDPRGPALPGCLWNMQGAVGWEHCSC